MGTNAKLGTGELLVAEADESDGTFLMLTPAIAVVTNISPRSALLSGTGRLRSPTAYCSAVPATVSTTVTVSPSMSAVNTSPSASVPGCPAATAQGIGPVG